MKDGCLSARDTGKRFQVFSLLLNDQQFLVYAVISAIYTVSIAAWFLDHKLGDITMAGAAVGAGVLVCYALFYWRFWRAQKLTHHGFWVKAKVATIRPTAKGHSQIHYSYEIDECKHKDWKEMVIEGNPKTMDLLVHPENHNVNMVLALPSNRFHEVWQEKRPDDPCPEHAARPNVRFGKKKNKKSSRRRKKESTEQE